MKTLRYTLLLLLLFASPAPAAERGTAEEAQALVEKAIARYKEVGAEQVVTEINTCEGSFADRDLYVFVVAPGPGHKLIAQAAKMVEPKKSFVKKVDGYIFGAGYYAP